MDIRNLRRLFPACPVLLVAAASALLILACGGSAIQQGGGNGDGGSNEDSMTCPGILPCPSNAYFDQTLCACVVVQDGDTGIKPGGCGALPCPYGQQPVEYPNGTCACQFTNNGEEVPDGDVPDADIADSTALDQETPDATDLPDEGPPDSPPWYYDVQPSYDSPYYVDQGVYCGYYPYCGPGYTYEELNGYCQCVACSMVCPNGQTPGNSCLSCVACTTTCPAGFYVGQNCNCIPDGVEAGPPPVYEAGPPGVDGGSGCTLEGYRTCALGSWCELGVCPDNKTQYGCYCDASGNATCNLACPQPQACNIPGLGTCAPGQTCIYGESACQNSQGDAGTVLECSCYNGSANCYSLSCASYESYYGPDSGFDSGPTDNDGGPSCYLQGYTQCPVGQYCQLGTCPGGTSYGCTCNSDGTTTCNLQCPPPPPCNIPGEGTCPYNQTCTYGTCSSSSDTLLNCSCGYGGQVNCYTSSCNGGPEGGLIVDAGGPG